MISESYGVPRLDEIEPACLRRLREACLGEPETDPFRCDHATEQVSLLVQFIIARPRGQLGDPPDCALQTALDRARWMFPHEPLRRRGLKQI